MTCTVFQFDISRALLIGASVLLKHDTKGVGFIRLSPPRLGSSVHAKIDVILVKSCTWFHSCSYPSVTVLFQIYPVRFIGTCL